MKLLSSAKLPIQFPDIVDTFEIKIGDSVLTVQRKWDREIYYIYLKDEI